MTRRDHEQRPDRRALLGLYRRLDLRSNGSTFLRRRGLALRTTSVGAPLLVAAAIALYLFDGWLPWTVYDYDARRPCAVVSSHPEEVRP